MIIPVDVRWLVLAAVVGGVFWLCLRRPAWIPALGVAVAACGAAYLLLYSPFGG